MSLSCHDKTPPTLTAEVAKFQMES